MSSEEPSMQDALNKPRTLGRDERQLKSVRTLVRPSLYSGRTTVAEVPYMEGFICKRKSYVDAGRVAVTSCCKHEL